MQSEVILPWESMSISKNPGSLLELLNDIFNKSVSSLQEFEIKHINFIKEHFDQDIEKILNIPLFTRASYIIFNMQKRNEDDYLTKSYFGTLEELGKIINKIDSRTEFEKLYSEATEKQDYINFIKNT